MNKEQIDKLNEYQEGGKFHPYTWGVLIATEDKWVCPCGKYEQKYDGSESRMIIQSSSF